MVKKKFGNMFYDFVGATQNESQAYKDRDQRRGLGSLAEVVHEKHETPWEPHEEVMGWSVYSRYIPKHRHRPSKKHRDQERYF